MKLPPRTFREPLPPAESPDPPDRHVLNGKPAKQTQKAPATANRFKTLNEFVDVTMAKVGTSASAVWFVLYRDARNNIAHTSQSDIARRTGLSARYVRTLLKHLEAAGAIKVLSRGNSYQTFSAYEVLGKP